MLEKEGYRPQVALFRDGFILVAMKSGAEIRFPVAENPRLAHGTAEQLNNIELSLFGLHWPDLDEDLSLRGLAQGDYGHVCAENNRRRAATAANRSCLESARLAITLRHGYEDAADCEGFQVLGDLHKDSNRSRHPHRGAR